MTHKYRIMGVQMWVAHETGENLPTILRYIGLAGQEKADFVLFPEMSLTGYHGEFDQEERDRALVEIADACRQHQVAVIIGTGDKQPEGTYIQLRAYAKDGSLIGTHEKLVPTNGDRKWCIPGQELRVYEYAKLRFGMLICNDMWVTPGCGPYPDPRLAYQLGQRGVQLVFHAINSGHDGRYIPYHESNLALRARESKFYIVTANAVQKKEEPVNAASGIVTPEGEWLIQANRVGEQHYIAEVEISP